MFRVIILFCVVLGVSACTKDQCKREVSYIHYTPIYMSVDDATQPIENLSPQPIENPGKIHYHRNFLLINEKRKGIHIMDNLDPSGPQNLGFISIPGNVDLITKNDILYADSYQDLLIIDIDNPLAATIVERRTEFFEFNKNEDGDLVVDDATSSHLVDEPCDQRQADAGWSVDQVRSYPDGSFDALAEYVGGIRRLSDILGVENYFGNYEQALYVSTPNNIRIFDISNASNPVHVNTLTSTINNIWGQFHILTLHAGEGMLLAATTSGMHVYDNTLPLQPEFLNNFGRDEFDNTCRQLITSWRQEGYFANEPCFYPLSFNMIYNATPNPNTGIIVREAFPFEEPLRGLAAYDSILYVAGADAGLYIIDAATPFEFLEPLATINHPANDVLILPAEFCSTGHDALIVTGENAIYQYDLSTPLLPNVLSEISIE